jgi:hypothetical protein
MMTLRFTVAEYQRWRAALPRGPLGVIWPGGVVPIVLIVPEPAPIIAAPLIIAAGVYAARARS